MLVKKVVPVAIAVLLLAVGATVFLASRQEPAPTTTPVVTEQEPITSVETPAPEPAPVPTIFYPLPQYASRLTERTFGQLFTSSSPNNLVCGGDFTGYHSGDDLEATAAEISQEVPVFAIADGTVRQLSRVSGYGGLLVIEHRLNGEAATVNYGHIDLSQPKVTVGAKITAGQIVGYLGANCSTETDGERKHLHFGIHKGSTVNVRGYVKTTSDLQSWHNPKELLGSLNAAEPQS